MTSGEKRRVKLVILIQMQYVHLCQIILSRIYICFSTKSKDKISNKNSAMATQVPITSDNLPAKYTVLENNTTPEHKNKTVLVR
jgi:UDP-N-acetylglucosamine:LPS N-acetylglucosamine transferase